MNNILGLRGSVKNLMSSREERSVIASTWKPMPKPSHLFSIEYIFWNSSSWSQKDAFRILGLLDMTLQICLWQARSPTAIPQINTFKASMHFRLPQLSPRIYHISNKPLSLMIQSGDWKKKKPFLTQTNPSALDSRGIGIFTIDSSHSVTVKLQDTLRYMPTLYMQ